jgi:hypothetical protein
VNPSKITPKFVRLAEVSSLDLQHYFPERFAFPREARGMPVSTSAMASQDGRETARDQKLAGLLQGDKSSPRPSSHSRDLLTTTLQDESKLGIIGGFGVNGPHYALAAKRFRPVRLSTASAHFLNLVPLLLHPLFTTQQQQHWTTTTSSHNELSTTLCEQTLNL